MRQRFLTSIFAFAGAAFPLIGSVQAQVAPPTSCGGALSFPGGAAACRDYLGSSWNPGTASADCSSIPGATGGVLQVGVTCSTANVVGVCRVGAGSPSETTLAFYGGNEAALKNACVGFLNGTWLAALPAGRCDHLAATAPSAPGMLACKEYTGGDWTAARGERDCLGLAQSNFTADVRCGVSSIGHCSLGVGTANEHAVHHYAGDAAQLKAGCEGFARGKWNDAADPGETVMPQALEALLSDDVVTVKPNDCDRDCVDELIGARGAITFAPTARAPKDGFLYIPGGEADPRAYSVAARQIAAAGFFVAIVPFPGGLAIADPMRPNAVIVAHPEIQRWAIGGHSLGGVTAAFYADKNPLQAIQALAIFGGYPPAGTDLSDNNLRVYSFLATEDAGLDLAEWTAAKAQLPAHTYYAEIAGGNHGQFGYYGLHAGDGEALISREHQHSIYVGATIHMLRHLGKPASQRFELPIYGSVSASPNAVCRAAQRRIAGLHAWDLRGVDVGVRNHETMVEFRGDHPGFPAKGSPLVDVISYAAQTSNPDDVTAPPIFDGEVWCKMKSQEAFVSTYGLAPTRAPGTCADANREVLEAALMQAHPRTRQKYLRAGSNLTFSADVPAATGPGFIEASISLTTRSQNRSVLASPTLLTPLVVPAPFGGVSYCKLWSPQAALKFIQSVTATKVALEGELSAS